MKRLSKYIYAIIFAGIIFYLCIMQLPDETPPVFQIPYFDKIVHALMYLGLTAIIFVEYFKNKQNFTWHKTWNFLVKGKLSGTKEIVPVKITSFLLSGALALAYGGIIEIIQQQFTSYRTGDWRDFLADLVGVLLAFFLFPLARRKAKK